MTDIHYSFIKAVPTTAAGDSLKTIALNSLSSSKKSLPYFLLYDDTGSNIFEEICELEEYYPTSCERNILETQVDDILTSSPPFTVLVELGSGSSSKTTGVIRGMLNKLRKYDTQEGNDHPTPMTYVPIDISGAILDESSKQLLKEMNDPRFNILAVNGFYKDGLEAVWRMFPNDKKLVMWLGSSVGNMEDSEAITFLREIREAITTKDRFLIGMDLMKDEPTLKAAYDDSKGVTARFSLNILNRLNSELGAKCFDTNNFCHHANVNKELMQVETYLKCLVDHTVTIDSNLAISFVEGELIKLERCAKYSYEKIDKYAKLSGFTVEKRWLDSRGMFSLNMFAPKPSNQIVENVGESVSAAQLQEIISRGWKCSDRVFSLLPSPADYYTKPIELRHPFVFYVGHVAAFSHSHVLTYSLNKPSFNSSYETLFSRGIDPSVDDPTMCHAHPDVPTSWPSMEDAFNYKNLVRQNVVSALPALANKLDAKRVVNLCAEHELMHSETLLYMLSEMDTTKLSHKQIGEKPKELTMSSPEFSATRSIDLTKMISIPAGTAHMGASFDAIDFGWDNEFPKKKEKVEAFEIGEYPITNSQFAEFVTTGNYNDPKNWKKEDWQWKQSINLEFPNMWVRNEIGEFYQRTLWGNFPLSRVSDWPVYVSWAEANAYAAWKKARLPTEPEFHRAAYANESSQYPWGDAAPIAGTHGNFGFNRCCPSSVTAHPAGASAHGVKDLVGNGWEWTSTLFAPFPGYIPHIPHYPGYSSDFFDGNHYVMKGGSWATDEQLLRRSFRNWFQPHYLYMFSKFRLVRCNQQ